jgi:hypothetical protein
MGRDGEGILEIRKKKKVESCSMPIYNLSSNYCIELYCLRILLRLEREIANVDY